MFSIVVIFTTVPVMRDCMRILLEGTPSGMSMVDIKDELALIEGVEEVEDIHFWALAGGKNCLSAHLRLKDDSDTLFSQSSPLSATRRVHSEAMEVADKYDVCHATF